MLHKSTSLCPGRNRRESVGKSEALSIVISPKRLVLLEIIWGCFTPTFLTSVRGKNMVLICLKKDFFFLNLSVNQPFTLAPLSLSHCIHVTLVISPPLCLHPIFHFHCHVPSIPSPSVCDSESEVFINKSYLG